MILSNAFAKGISDAKYSSKANGMNSFVLWLGVILLNVSVSIAIGCNVLVLCQVLLFGCDFYQS